MLNALVFSLLLLAPQQTPTVAVIVSPDAPAEIISRSEAEAQFKKLCVDGSDDRRLKALAAELNPMPNYPQMVMNGDASVCNRSPKPLVSVPVRTSWSDPK